jgi:hypothetical protein
VRERTKEKPEKKEEKKRKGKKKTWRIFSNLNRGVRKEN